MLNIVLFDKTKDACSYLCSVSCTDNTGFGYWHSDANDGFIKLSFRFKKNELQFSCQKCSVSMKKKIWSLIIFSKLRGLFLREELKVQFESQNCIFIVLNRNCVFY